MAKFLEYVGKRESGKYLVAKIPPKSPYRYLSYKKGQVWKLGKDLPEKIGEFINISCPALFKIRHEKDNPVELFEELIKKASEIQQTYSFEYVDILKKYFEISKTTRRGRKPKK